MKLLPFALLGIAMLSTPLTSFAQSYQAEAEINISRTTFDFDRGRDADANVIGLAGRYFLAPVEIVGPWSESAFLQKSSSVGISLSRVSGDVDSDTDFDVDVRYVTPENLILGGELSSSDATDISAFGGIYLDDRSTAIARISLGDIDTLGVEYRNLLQLSGGNSLAAEASFTLQDAADTGFEIDVSSTYYLSDQLGLLAGLSYEDIGNFDLLTLTSGAEYFISPTIAVAGGLSLGFGDPQDRTNILIGALARF